MGDHWRQTKVALVCAVSVCLASSASGDAHFVGPQTCGLCRRDISAAPARTALANTSQGRWPASLSRSFGGTGQGGGVHCESCHGPGSRHLTELGRGNASQGIVNPKRLSTEGSIAVCAQCHVGLARFSDPAPEDLLIANQVRAIRSSECFL